ncbi:MAG: IS66 family transposase [Proteobacteria bacterium]|nr:IS66 family transposase [Pseudomonadota bacterium]
MIIDPAVLALVDELRSEVAELRRENEALRRENAELKARVVELEAKLARYEGKPPTDPSTPSGMTPPFHKKNKKGKRKKPGRKKGHAGSHRAALEPNRFESHPLVHCPDCGTDLRDKPKKTRTRTTHDLPPKSEPEVTAHGIEGAWCPKCKKYVEARVDAALPRSTLGLRVVLLAAWMHYALGTPAHAVVKYLKRAHGFPVTVGGLTQAWRRLADALAPMHTAIWEEIRGAGVLHADETGWRVDGRTCWLWCFATKSAVYYVIDKTRGSKVVRRVLGECFSGVLVTDFFAAYGFLCAAAKQKCLAHLLRELEKVGLRNAGEEWRGFAAKAKRFLKDALRLGVDRAKYDDAEYDRRWRRLHDRLSELWGGDYADKDCYRLARRLERHRDELLVFLERDNVDATNNHGERAIRPAVVMRKNYGGNRSEAGAEIQAELMSIFRTLEMRGVDPLDYLERALRASLARGEQLTLPALPAEDLAA